MMPSSLKTGCLSAAFLFLNCIQSNAQSGGVDTGFGHVVTTLGDSTRFNQKVHSVVIQSDGKYLIAGEFTSYNGINRNRITRLNVDGSLDNSFAVPSGFNSAVKVLALQPDGKIIAGGMFTTYNSFPRAYIARIDTNGSLDNTFAVGTGFNGTVNDIKLQPDGKILVGGEFTTYNDITRRFLARLNSDGSLDATFAETGSGLNAGVNALVYDSNTDKLVVGGSFSTYNGITRKRITGINSDGSLDVDFVVGTGFASGISGYAVTELAIQANGKIVVAGDYLGAYNGVNCENILRLNADGSLDNTFNAGASTTLISAVTLHNDAVYFSGYQGLLHRLLSDGSVDATFDSGEGFYYDGANSIAVRSDGKLVAGGYFSRYNETQRGNIVLIEPNGRAENKTFKLNYGAPLGYAGEIERQANGKILLSGIVAYNDIMVNGVARLNLDGSLDTTFHPAINLPNAGVMRVQPDGKIIVAGNFVNSMVRLLPNGDIDNTFAVGSGFNQTVRAIALQPDGKIVVGGAFNSFDGVARNKIARLESNGILDLSFDVGDGFGNSSSNFVAGLAIQSDEKIIAVGDFGSYDGNPNTAGIARINPDGSVDASFVGGPVSNLRAVAVRPNDGKIIIGGRFTHYNYSNWVAGIARLHPDGTLDSAFVVGSGFPGGFDTNYEAVYCLLLQPDEKILVGGGFKFYNGITRNRIARLNANGSYDDTFVSGAGFDGYAGSTIIRSMALQPDGKVITCGNFETYDLHFSRYIIRLENTVGSVATESIENAVLSVYPNPASDNFVIETTGLNGSGSFIMTNAFGQEVQRTNVTNGVTNIQRNGLPSGIYFFRLEFDDAPTRAGKILFD